MNDELIAAVRQFENVNVVCVGDPMLDHFVYGSTSRISPEAPIPILKFDRQVSMLGGAANTARNVCSLGGRVTLLAPIGKDDAGETLKSLQSGEVRMRAFYVADARGTTVKTRYVASGQQLLRVDYERVEPLAADASSELLSALQRLLTASHALIISDYGKGVVTDHFCREAIRLAREAGVLTIVDPKGRDYTKYTGAKVVTPNFAELQAISPHSLDTFDAVVDAARNVARNNDIEFVVVTRGAQGVVVVGRDGFLLNVPAHKVAVYDVSGAGDTFVGALACALAISLSVDQAAVFANAAANVSVTKPGTATVTRQEVANELRGSQHRDQGQVRIVRDFKAAEQIVADWRAEGGRIGFTNGCFDLLHPGHLHVLNGAKKQCDKLVVGINSDFSVKRLKGEGRPVRDEAARAEILANLSAVDLVVIFGEETPLALVEALEPDVIVKGGDYGPDTIVGSDVVRRRGGEVVIIPTLDGHSTTLTLSKIGNSG